MTNPEWGMMKGGNGHSRRRVGRQPVEPALARRVLLCTLVVAPVFLGTSCRRKPPEATPTVIETITTKSGIEMVLVPAGEFVMGDVGAADDEKPAHRVRVGAFYMDRFEVTQRAYKSLTGRDTSKFRGDANRPVERLSWRAAAIYCNLRSMREGRTPCYDPATIACDFDANGYRLPTEAEWEYACRAGAPSAYAFGANPADLPGFGWFKDNAGKKTHPVGERKPNAWGLHDLHGNVAEWCQDRYAEDAYAQRAASPAVDPRGPVEGDRRVLRGGSWKSTADACRSAARAAEEPGLADVCFGYDAYGFRCVRRATEPPTASPAGLP